MVKTPLNRAEEGEKVAQEVDDLPHKGKNPDASAPFTKGKECIISLKLPLRYIECNSNGRNQQVKVEARKNR